MVSSHFQFTPKQVMQMATVGPRKSSKLAAILKVMDTKEHWSCLDVGVNFGALALHFSEKGSWSFIDPEEDSLEVAKNYLRGQFIKGSVPECIEKISF